MKIVPVLVLFFLPVCSTHAAVCLDDYNRVVPCNDPSPPIGNVHFSGYQASQEVPGKVSIFMNGGATVHLWDNYRVFVNGGYGCDTDIADGTPVWTCDITIGSPGIFTLTAYGHAGLPAVGPQDMYISY